MFLKQFVRCLPIKHDTRDTLVHTQELSEIVCDDAALINGRVETSWTMTLRHDIPNSDTVFH